MYDSMAEEGHREAHTKLRSSAEEILNGGKQQEWTLEEMPASATTNGRGKLWILLPARKQS